MRDGNPANNQNWALVCSGCAAQYDNVENIDLANGHWQQNHLDIGETPSFNLVWIGKGPAPKKGRTQPRRRGRRW